MILVDNRLQALEAAGTPIRVALVGAGFMGAGLTNQIVNSVPGMTISVIVNRTVDKGLAAYTDAGVDDAIAADGRTLADALERARPVVTDDLDTVCASAHVDVVVDATGAVEYGCRVAETAIAGGKHLVLMNAEVDGTVGWALYQQAKAAGVVYTGCDGDQPGVQMNLVRFVRGIGLRPLVAGNVKGLHDPYRTPTTQQGFAEKWGQDPAMVTSFADGTKISFEQALVANATGMTVERRGMRGADHHGRHVDELTGHYDVDELERLGGVVDYVVGADPGPGVYVLATHDDPRQRHYLNLYKLGEGPLYSFYTPYHLCHFEVPITVARAALFDDATLRPLGPPTVEVVTTAKTDLRAGDEIDGLGGYMTYGLAERADVTAADDLLPLGVAKGCRLVVDVAKDQVLTYADVEVPAGRAVDRLRAAQDQRQVGGDRTTS
jgi:predicted homoserine dehydrogenase-like protein